MRSNLAWILCEIDIKKGVYMRMYTLLLFTVYAQFLFSFITYLAQLDEEEI